MPPRQAGGGAPRPDPLDVALKSPGLHTQVPGQKGFFNALKPVSPLFSQTSRVNVDRPAAQARVAARIVPAYTPPQTPSPADAKAQAEAKLPHSSSLGSLAKQVAEPVLHHPLRTAAMLTPGPLSLLANPLVGKGAHAANTVAQKGVQAVAKAQAGPNLQGAASTNAAVLNAYKASGSLPYASLSADVQQKLQHAIAFFAANPTYHYPSLPNLGFTSADEKKKLGLPPNATDADALRKQYEPFTGKRGFISELVHNVPLDLAQNVAAPLGALDIATHPTTMGPEFLRQQVDFGRHLIEHPLDTLKHQPVTVGTLGLTALRGAGGAGGTFARSRFNLSEGLKTFATPAPREVIPAGFKDRAVGPNGENLVPPIDRGLSSPKLDVRVAQAASDALARHMPAFGQRLDKRAKAEITKESNRFSHQLQRNEVEPGARASAKLSKREQRANVSFIGQGYHSLAEAAQHTRMSADQHAATQAAETAAGREVAWRVRQKDLDQKAEIAAKLAAKVDISKPKFQEALRANTAASRSGERQMVEQGVGNPQTHERAAYIPRAKIEADLYGDPTATRVLDLAHQANALTDELARAKQGSPRRAALAQQIEQLQRVQADQAKAARPERGTSERLAQRHADLFSGKREVPTTSPLFEAPTRSAPASISWSGAQDAVLAAKKANPDAYGRIPREHEQASQTTYHPRFFYHRSKTQNRESILSTGLEANRSLGGKKTRIYLDATHDPPKPRSDTGATDYYKIDTHGLTLRPDPEAPGRWAISEADIPPDRIRLTHTTSPDHPVPHTDEFSPHVAIPSRSAMANADMRKGVETRTRQRAARPLDARIERAQTRLGKIRTPEQVQRAIEGTHAEQMGLVHDVRAKFRDERGAPPVEKGAPLDEHDPLWMQHAIESPKTFFGLRRGTSLTGTNRDASAAYGKRLGAKGHQRTGDLFPQSSSDMSIYFKGLGKPQKVTAKLRHLDNQLKSAIKAPPPGSEYDVTKFHLLNLAKGKGQGALDVHTTADATQALHDLSDEGLRSKIMDQFEAPTGRHGDLATVPDDGGEYYLLTHNAKDLVQGTLKTFDNRFLRAAAKTTSFWRWATLTARPAWLVNNFGGNTVQTLMEGVGPKSMIRALRTGTGGKYEGVVPPQTNSGGFFGGTFERPEGVRSGLMHPIDRVSQGVVNLNTKFENFARRAVAVQESLNIAKAQLHGEQRTIANNLHRTTQEVIDLARQRTPEADAQIMGRVHHALGDFLGKGNQNPALGVLSPFHRWFSFITKLTLEMPVRTPGRALVMQRLGQFGIDVQNQETGGFTPNSWLGQVRVPNWVPHFGGEYKSTQALWPYSTLYQLAAPTGQDTTDPGQIGYTGALGALNPMINAGIETATGLNPTFNFQQLKDSSGNPVGPLNPSVGAHAVEASFPFVNLLTGYGTTPDSLNPLAPTTKARGALAQPQQDVYDRLAGYFLGSVAHRDFLKNQIASYKRLAPAEHTLAVNRAKAGHGPK